MKRPPFRAIASSSFVAIAILAFGPLRLAQGVNADEAAPVEPVTSVFRVEGMTCGGCEAGVKLRVGKLDGVTSVDASYEEGTATVTFDPEQVGPEQIVAAIETLGYTAQLVEEPEAVDETGRA